MTAAVDPAIRRIRRKIQLPTLAKRLRIARQAPYAWRRVPAARVLAVSRITGIEPHLLRPDLYPPPRKGGNGIAAR